MPTITKKTFIKYFSNTTWRLAERVIHMSVALIVGIYVARFLGPDNLGVISYAQSLIAIISILPALGLESLLVREIVSNQHDTEKVNLFMGTAFFMRIMGLLAMYLPLGLFLFFTEDNIETTVIVLIISMSQIVTPFLVIDYYFQAKVKAKYVVFPSLIQTIFATFSKLVLIAMKAPLIMFAAVFALEALVLVVGLIVSYQTTRLQIKNWQFNTLIAKQLLRDGWPLILGAVLVLIHMRIDQVMIKFFLGPESVGQYAVAVRIATATYIIPMVVSSSLFPSIVKNRSLDNTKYFSLVQLFYDLSLWGGVAIALPLSLLAPLLVPVLFGEAFTPASSVLALLSWSTVFVFVAVSSGKWMMAENYTGLVFYRNLFGAISNVLLNLFLIPRWGINGAAVATLSAQLIASYLVDPLFKDMRISFVMKMRAFLPFHIPRLLKELHR